MSLLDGSSRPRPGEAVRGLLLRAILPGILVWLVIVGFGELLRGPLKPLNHTESGLSDVLIGALNGIACALLAWTCLRTHHRRTADASSTHLVR
jgi:hypothetical protein